MYGENAATFLIFQALATTPDAIEKVLLSNLKQFGSRSRRPFKARQVKESEMWLFPNFGKSDGFGEPDAILLADEDVFWFEVETKINFQKAITSLHKTLLQLWRFRVLQDALTRSSKQVNNSLRIVGKTIDNKWQLKDAKVKIANHGVLKKLRRRLAKAGKDGRDHYVLFTVNKPKGPGKKLRSYGEALKSETENLKTNITGVERLPVDRCYYAYWKDDLESKFAKHCDCHLCFDEQYVPIKHR
jgi:hypothetical protein